MAQTILVVDDEPQIVRLVRAYLEEDGFRVVTASDGQEALYVARHEKPDLVVLDVLMPRMDGLEFTRRIRNERDLPIIMLTARAEEVVDFRCRSASAPGAPSALICVLRKDLSLNQMEQM